MPFAFHQRITFSGIFGTLAAPVEQWSFRLNTGPLSVQDTASGLTAAATAWATHLAPQILNTARLTQVKFAPIGPDGRYTGEPLVKNVDTPGTGASGQPWPPQIALVASLTSATRGPAGRGRIYLPAPSTGPLTSTFLLPTGIRDNFQSATKGFINALNAIPEFGVVSIASTKGSLVAVTGVRVGRVLDTVRSRRRDQPEDYSVPLPL